MACAQLMKAIEITRARSASDCVAAGGAAVAIVDPGFGNSGHGYSPADRSHLGGLRRQGRRPATIRGVMAPHLAGQLALRDFVGLRPLGPVRFRLRSDDAAGKTGPQDALVVAP